MKTRGLWICFATVASLATGCGDDGDAGTSTGTGNGTGTGTSTVTSTGTGTGSGTGSGTGTGTMMESSSCTDPIGLTVGEAVTGDNSAGDSITDGTCQTVVGGGDSPDVIYELVPDSDQPLRFSLTSTDGADLGIVVQTECGNVETEILCADLLFSGSVETELGYLVAPTPGESLFVVMSGFSSQAIGTYELLVETYTPVCGDGAHEPPEICEDGGTANGDGCDDSCEFECTSSPIAVGTTLGDTTGSQSVHIGTCTGRGPEVLYEFTPSVTGELTATLDPSAGGADLGLYARSGCVDPDSQVACGDLAEAGLPEVLTFAVEAGVPVTLYVEGFTSTDEGAFSLDLVETEAICGDGIVTLPEDCDDSNVIAADGCDGCTFVDQVEVEPNDVFGDATPLFPGKVLGASLPLAPAMFDHDYLAFDVPGPLSTVSVFALGGGADACGPGGIIDSEVELFDTDGVTSLAYNDDIDGANNYCAAVQVMDLPAGTYYVRTSTSASMLCMGCSDTYDYETFIFVE